MATKEITNFPITVYGNMEKFSDTISRGRCRVFYKGRNRNGTFITDEFAQKLIDSAPYTPIKGIYDELDEDYTDHGQKRSEGRIYGLIPQDPNFAWEKHVDVDGIEREYACFDVLYYTALYKEAGQIDGKSESMELYRGTLKGEWQIIDGKKTYVFTDGCFLGLQALGDDTEPCFEGASFYSLEQSVLALLEKYEKKIDLFQSPEQGGTDPMPSISFKLSDGQKYDFLFRLLNPAFGAENDWTIEYVICEVYEDYAVVVNCAEGIHERVYFTKDDETDSLSITSKERCYIVDVNEAEKAALAEITAGETYEATASRITEQANTIKSQDEKINSLTEEATASAAEYEKLKSEFSELDTKFKECQETNFTLVTERDNVSDKLQCAETRVTELEESIGNYTKQISELTSSVDSITEERDILAAYKKAVEDDAKKAVIETYAETLPEEVIAKYMSNLDNYSIEDLDKELTYEQKKANPSLFTKTPAPVPALLPKDEGNQGIYGILARHEKK